MERKVFIKNSELSPNHWSQSQRLAISTTKPRPIVEYTKAFEPVGCYIPNWSAPNSLKPVLEKWPTWLSCSEKKQEGRKQENYVS